MNEKRKWDEKEIIIRFRSAWDAERHVRRQEKKIHEAGEKIDSVPFDTQPLVLYNYILTLVKICILFGVKLLI